MEGRFNRPAHALFAKAHFFHTERLSVGCGGVLFVRASEANVGTHCNQRRPSALRTRILQCEGHCFDVVAPLHLLHVPAECSEPGHTIFGECQFCAPLDRDVVVCIKNDEFAKMLVARIRSGLRRNSFLKVSIADENIGIVVHDPVAGTIESRRQRHLGNCHANAIRSILAPMALW